MHFGVPERSFAGCPSPAPGPGSLPLRCLTFEKGRMLGFFKTENRAHLRFSAKICGFCGFLRPPNAWISKKRGESAKISGFLQKPASWALSVTLVPSP